MRSAISSGKFQAGQVYTIEIPLKNNVPVADSFVQEDKNEIRYHGDMYDVISTRWEVDKVIYTCIGDKEETRLIALFAEQVQKQNDQPVNGKKTVSFIKFSITPFTITEQVIGINFQAACSHADVSLASEKLAIAYINIPSPPPWQA